VILVNSGIIVPDIFKDVPYALLACVATADLFAPLKEVVRLAVATYAALDQYL